MVIGRSSVVAGRRPYVVAVEERPLQAVLVIPEETNILDVFMTG